MTDYRPPLRFPRCGLDVAIRLASLWLISLIAALWPAWYGLNASPPSAQLSIAPGAGEVVIYDWNKDKCDATDTPDESARAFRDTNGEMHVFATHSVNRAFVGASLEDLRHPCAVVFAGKQNDDPEQFNDRQWLTSFWTKDGRHVVALIHNEFHGHLRPWLCKSGSYIKCWGNVITFATSNDAGATFSEPAAPANLVASPPFEYRGDVGHPIGYFAPTNIVERDGYDYFMFLATQFERQARGICVARTKDVNDPKSWRGWNGHDFSVQFVDPYLAGSKDAESHVCAPVTTRAIFEIGSLSYDEPLNEYVAVSSIAHENATAHFPAGAYFATSPDLVTWSDPALIASETSLLAGDPDRDKVSYYSLIDVSAKDRNFSTISSKPDLRLIYVAYSRKHPPYDRKLAFRKVRLQGLANSESEGSATAGQGDVKGQQFQHRE